MIRRRLGRALDWRFQAVVERLDSITRRVDDLDTQLKATQAAIARLQPMLRAVLDEEAENRRRLCALRDSPAYADAFTNPDPLVSAVVATQGKRTELVTRALPSLLGQSHSNLEVLVVGDATDPGIEEAVRALGDDRVRFWNLSQRLVAHPEPRRHWLVGSTMARNEATRHARGHWLLQCDDDDQVRLDAVALLLELARERHAEVAYGGYEAHFPDGRHVRHLEFPPQWEQFAWPAALIHGGLRFFERELVATELELPGDAYLLLRMLRAGVRFAMLEGVVLDYYPSNAWTRDGRPATASVLASLTHPSPPPVN